MKQKTGKSTRCFSEYLEPEFLGENARKTKLEETTLNSEQQIHELMLEKPTSTMSLELEETF